MGVTYLPGLDQQLGPAIGKLADAVNNYFQPNKEFQKHLQAQLAANPELIVKFADLEAKSPGTLARLGFGNLGQDIAQVPESAAGEISRTQKGAQVEAAAAGTAAATSQARLSQATDDNILAVMRDNPGLTYQAAKAKLTTQAAQGTIAEQEAARATQ